MHSLAAALTAVLSLTATTSTGAAPPPPTVAVLYFDYDGKRDELAVLQKGLAQMLISDLGGIETCRLVERSRLQALLDEQKLGRSGRIDAATAARVGKLLGARMMILGGYFELGQVLRVDARLVDVESGRILATSGATGKADAFLELEQRLAGDLERQVRRQLESAAKAGPTAPPSPDRGRPSPRRTRPTPPARLDTKTALAFSQALASADKGDRVGAQAGLRGVLQQQPDFQLARAELEHLLQ